jgi:REase_DpnII-MboI
MPLDTALLQRLEDELLYAILDVSQDIQANVDVGAEPIYIPFRRMLIRYEILCPANTPGIISRYCELRWKACGFLKKHAVIVDYHSDGNDHWDGIIQIFNPSEPKLLALVDAFQVEVNRRELQLSFNTNYTGALQQVAQLAETFHRAALSLLNRQHNRPDFQVANEYDVQDLFGAMLYTRFKDVRREEYGPSCAGGSTRADFYIKDNAIVVEIKMTRDGLNDKKLGEELIIDIAHYKQRGCKAVICFVYDPEHRLKNPNAIEIDLSKPTDGIEVRVMIRPKG